VRLVTPSSKPRHSHFFCAKTNARVGYTRLWQFAHAVFAHVKLLSNPSNDHCPEPWSRHQAAVRRDVWIGPPSLPVSKSPERRSRQVTGPQVPLTLAARGPVVISRLTHFPARLGVVPGGPYFIGVLVSKSGNKSLFKSMDRLIYTLPHASSFDIHKSNLHFPCSVPGKNLIVTTKSRVEYPKHMNVLVQTVPQEDGEKVGLRVDNHAQLWPETSQCNLFFKHAGPVTRKVQQVETCKFEPTCWRRLDARTRQI